MYWSSARYSQIRPTGRGGDGGWAKPRHRHSKRRRPAFLASPPGQPQPALARGSRLDRHTPAAWRAHDLLRSRPLCLEPWRELPRRPPSQTP